MESGVSRIVIGVGNSYRGDDAAGLVLARRLRERVPEGVRVLELEDETTDLLEAWRGAERVALVDAVSSGNTPGTIHRFRAEAGPLPSPFFRLSTHAVNVAETIELARVLHQLPAQLVVYGIEGKEFQAGTGLSPEVEGALGAVMEQVLHEMRRPGV